VLGSKPILAEFNHLSGLLGSRPPDALINRAKTFFKRRLKKRDKQIKSSQSWRNRQSTLLLPSRSLIINERLGEFACEAEKESCII
jgi:hypothetical protein